jgi:hypothetical protein
MMTCEAGMGFDLGFDTAPKLRISRLNPKPNLPLLKSTFTL